MTLTIGLWYLRVNEMKHLQGFRTMTSPTDIETGHEKKMPDPMDWFARIWPEAQVISITTTWYFLDVGVQSCMTVWLQGRSKIKNCFSSLTSKKYDEQAFFSSSFLYYRPGPYTIRLWNIGLSRIEIHILVVKTSYVCKSSKITHSV